MSWDEIDFDLIISGMITRGPAEASIADILNQFALAGDERQNLIGENPAITGLTFEAGEIRNTIFWDKYRDLIAQYRTVMLAFTTGRRGGTYYTREVMTDPTNSPLYEVDFINVLGIDLFSKFLNDHFYTNAELFTAEVINGFYIIYQNTEILKVLSKSGTTTTQNIPITITNSGDYYESTPVTGAAGGSFNDLLPLAWTQKVDTFSAGLIGYFEMRAALNFSFGVWRWSTLSGTGAPNLRNKNGLDIVLDMRDLNNNLLDVDFIGYGNMQSNQSRVETPLSEEPYNTDYSFKRRGTSRVDVEWMDVITNNGPSGTTKTISVSGGSPLQPNDLFFPEPGPVGKSENQFLSIRASPALFVDLNNPALEFYIAP